MKGRTDPSCPEYKRPDNAEERRSEYLSGNGRRPSLKIPTHHTLKGLGIPVAGKTIDCASLPLKAEGGDLVLDLARVEAELLRTGKQAPSLATIAVRWASTARGCVGFTLVCTTPTCADLRRPESTRPCSFLNRLVIAKCSEPVACIMYDLAINEAGIDDDAFCGDDIAYVAANMGRLVGHLIPVFSQVRPTLRPGDPAARKTKKRKASDLNMDPIQPLGEGGALPRKAHAFAMQPVQLSTVGTHDQGVFLAGGVIVSNKCFNYPQDDPKRISTGRNPAFEETVCWMLVTHTYDGLTYAQLGPPSTKTVRTADREERVQILDVPGRNTHDALFQWRAFMDENLGEGRRAGVSSFGFTDIKQTGKDTTRRILPWTIEDVVLRLETMRAAAGRDLVPYLRDLPMKALMNNDGNLNNRPVGGLDLRRMLLIELLLTGTPLEALLRPRDAGRALALPAAPKVPGGAAGLYERMKDFCDSVYE